MVTTAASLSAKSAKQFVFILKIFIGFLIKSNVNSLYFSKKNFLLIYTPLSQKNFDIFIYGEQKKFPDNTEKGKQKQRKLKFQTFNFVS